METDRSESGLSPAGSAGESASQRRDSGKMDTPKQRTAAEIRDWFVAYLAKLLNTPPEKIDVTVPFESFALDSVTAVGMTGDLEEWLGRGIDPTMVFDYPTIESLSGYLAEGGDAG